MAPQPKAHGGAGTCSMCGSKRASIHWDAKTRSWFCTLRTEEPRPATPRKPTPSRPEPPEPKLPELLCDRCGAVVLGGALPGVSAYCKRCRRWVVQSAPGATS